MVRMMGFEPIRVLLTRPSSVRVCRSTTSACRCDFFIIVFVALKVKRFLALNLDITSSLISKKCYNKKGSLHNGGFMTFVIVALIILVSSIVQGATSFGFSLLALPLLGYFYELKVIVPTLVIFSIVLNLIILIRLRLVPKIKELLLLAFFAICFIPLGVKILIFVDESLLKKIVGILLIVISIIMFKGVTLNLKHKRVSYVIAGILSGILNGAVSLSGPPIVVLLASDNKNKNEFRASLTFLFLLLNVVTIVLFTNNGLFENKEIINLIYFIPVMIIGTFMGIYLGNKIDDQKFKKIVLILLMCMGMLNLF